MNFDLDLGIQIILILLLWMVVEIVILAIINWNFSFKKYEKDEDISSESRLYGTRALTLSGLTFAAIALLIGTSEDISLIINTLIVLVYGFCLLLCSYKLEVLTNSRRIYWKLQEKFLNFGYLTLIFALIIFFYENSVYTIVNVIVIFIAVILIIHLIEFILNDCKLYYDMREHKKTE